MAWMSLCWHQFEIDSDPGGLLWPGELKSMELVQDTPVKTYYKGAVPREPSGLVWIAFPLLSIAQLSGKRWLNWAIWKGESRLLVPLSCSSALHRFTVLHFWMRWPLSIQFSPFLGYQCMNTPAPQKGKTSSRHTIFSSDQQPGDEQGKYYYPFFMDEAWEVLFFQFQSWLVEVTRQPMYPRSEITTCCLILDSCVCLSQNLGKLELHKNLSNHDFKNLC